MIGWSGLLTLIAWFIAHKIIQARLDYLHAVVIYFPILSENVLIILDETLIVFTLLQFEGQR